MTIVADLKHRFIFAYGDDETVQLKHDSLKASCKKAGILDEFNKVIKMIKKEWTEEDLNTIAKLKIPNQLLRELVPKKAMKRKRK